MKFFKSQTLNKNDNQNVDKVFPEAAGTNEEEGETNLEASTENKATSSNQPEGTNNSRQKEEDKRNKKTKPNNRRVKATKTTESQEAKGNQKTPERRYNLRPRQGC